MEYTTKIVPFGTFEGNFTKWGQEEKEYIEKLLNQFKSLGRNVEAFENLSIDEDGKEYFESFKILLDGDISIRWNKYDNDITFWSEKLSSLPYVRGFNLDETIKKPNKVRVLTSKAIDNWVTYRREQYKQAKELSEKRTQEVETFLKEISKLNGIVISKDKDHGEAHGQYLSYSFNIGDEGYIEQRVGLNRGTYGSEALEVFKRVENI